MSTPGISDRLHAALNEYAMTQPGKPGALEIGPGEFIAFETWVDGQAFLSDDPVDETTFAGVRVIPVARPGIRVVSEKDVREREEAVKR